MCGQIVDYRSQYWDCGRDDGEVQLDLRPNDKLYFAEGGILGEADGVEVREAKGDGYYQSGAFVVSVANLLGLGLTTDVVNLQQPERKRNDDCALLSY